jgi:hypothetical protein
MTWEHDPAVVRLEHDERIRRLTRRRQRDVRSRLWRAGSR